MTNAPTNEIKKLEVLTIVDRSETEGLLRLSLAGKMTANGIGELRRELDEARRRRKPVQVDLGEVTLMDRVSVEFLNSVSSPMVRFLNCPEYLYRWIHNAQPATQ
ncbi:MAG: STAS domain-containing protein [Bryobacteraceae bacterium]